MSPTYVVIIKHTFYPIDLYSVSRRKDIFFDGVRSILDSDSMEDPSIILENNRIAGLEAQILSSQESLIRANRELDSALLRITTLENVCLENQTDLHEKRTRISELNDQITEYEQTNEHLIEELNDKNEKIENLNAIITQLKEHIKQKNDEYTPDIPFNQQLRELILTDHSFSFNSPEDLLHQYQHHQRSKFHDLLQESLITEDISQLIDSDDILFELFIHLNSLNRLKETLSRDSKHLQDIRSFLHLSIEYEDQSLQDLVNKRECMEYLRSKIEIDDPMSDLELVKYVLHDYFDYQQQKMEFKEYLQIHSEENSTWRILIERCERANHVRRFWIPIDINLVCLFVDRTTIKSIHFRIFQFKYYSTGTIGYSSRDNSNSNDIASRESIK